MKKKEFIEAIGAEGLEVAMEDRISPVNFGEWRADLVRVKTLTIRPESINLMPGVYFHHTPVVVPSRTRDTYTRANAEAVAGKLKPYRRFWRGEFGRHKKSPEYRKIRPRVEFYDLCIKAGLHHDEHGSYTERGTYHSLSVEEFVHHKRDLRRYHASGRYLGLVEVATTTVYAKSSDWRPSTRHDRYVVGENESGTPFCHQVPHHIGSLADAISWIWGGARIVERQGDVAIAECKLKHVWGVCKAEYRIIDSHYYTGEVRQNGQGCYVRNGRLYHTKGQHPDIIVGDQWRRVVIGRRSERGGSSWD